MSRPLQILSISSLFPRPDKPGFGRFVERQFNALAARGDVDLTVISPIGKRFVGGKASLDSSRAYPVYYQPFGSIPLIGAAFNPAFMADAVTPLARQLHDKNPFDLVDAQFFFPDGPAAGLLAGRLDLPLTIKARGSDINYWGYRRSAIGQMQAAARHAKALLAVSDALKAEMSFFGLELGKTAVHYTGLDHGLYRPHPRAEARAAVADLIPSDSKPLLVSIGNLIPLKRQGLAIRALVLLPDMRLAIVGQGPDAAKLGKLAAKLGVADRVTLTGALPPGRIAVLLSSADALLHTSKNEGLANVWIEALACGTPLVITDVGGAREVVQSPTAGRLVERTTDAIAAAVRELLATPPSQAEVAAHAARFSWEANAAQLAEHYRLVAGLGPSRAIRS